jgi:hypothetical protein
MRALWLIEDELCGCLHMNYWKLLKTKEYNWEKKGGGGGWMLEKKEKKNQFIETNQNSDHRPHILNLECKLYSNSRVQTMFF